MHTHCRRCGDALAPTDDVVGGICTLSRIPCFRYFRAWATDNGHEEFVRYDADASKREEVIQKWLDAGAGGNPGPFLPPWCEPLS